MNITTTKKAVRNPEAFSTADLHEALDVLVNDERFTEKQVANGQYAIEAELTKRNSVKLTSEELLYGLNRAIWAIQESGRYEDAETMRTIRDRAFDFKAMGFES